MIGQAGRSLKFIMTPEAFWQRVDKSGGAESCWTWTGGIDRYGYGKVGHKRKKWKAHRLAWMFSTGNRPNLWILHRCDNRPCCNPDHLFEGTHQDNMRDMAAKGRSNKGKSYNTGKHGSSTISVVRHHSGEKNPSARLREFEVLQIRSDVRAYPSIASQYGISVSHVCNIKARRFWGHLF
jgi:hypothetical protein